MVGRSMRDAHLVPRSYEEIETSLQDFLVLTIDGNVWDVLRFILQKSQDA